MKLPSIHRPRNIVRKRENGSTEVLGLTGLEWLSTVGALITLWALMAAVFIGLLAAAENIRGRGEVFIRPGTDADFPAPL